MENLNFESFSYTVCLLCYAKSSVTVWSLRKIYSLKHVSVFSQKSSFYEEQKNKKSFLFSLLFSFFVAVELNENFHYANS